MKRPVSASRKPVFADEILTSDRGGAESKTAATTEATADPSGRFNPVIEV
ncbi:MAG: hypothetical protein ACE14S_11080 [Candidatus Bathyarchaeia archaeon]